MKEFRAGDVQEVTVVPEYRPNDDGTVSVRIAVHGLAEKQAQEVAEQLLAALTATLAQWGQLIVDQDGGTRQ